MNADGFRRALRFPNQQPPTEEQTRKHLKGLAELYRGMGHNRAAREIESRLATMEGHA